MAHIAVEPQDVLALALENSAVSASPDVARLIGIARMMKAMPTPEIDPAFIHRLEARLLATSFAGRTEETPGRRLSAAPAASPAPAVTSVPANVVALPRRRFVIRKSVVAAVAAAALTAVPIVASGSAIPGSMLYPIKKSIERLHLAMTQGPVADGFLLLKHAQRRLDEVDQLVALGHVDLVPPTLDDMNTSLRRGTDLILGFTREPKTLRLLADTLQETTTRISSILKNAPPVVQSALLESLLAGESLSQQVDEALGISADVTAPASTAAPLPANPEVSHIADEDITSYFKMDSYYKKTPAAPGPRGNDDTQSSETRSSCLQRMYVGPQSGSVHSTCTVTNNASDPAGGVTRNAGLPDPTPSVDAPPVPEAPAPPRPPAPPSGEAPAPAPGTTMVTEAAPAPEVPASEDEVAETVESARGHGNAGDKAKGKPDEVTNSGKSEEAHAKKDK